MGRPHRHIDQDLIAYHKKPGLKVLDLYCCSGVGAEGYIRAGANILGIDIVKPSYYPGTFWLQDVTLLTPEFLQHFDFIHASPPCQGYSRGTGYLRKHGLKEYPYMIDATRDLLKASGVPSVIENIPESGIPPHFMLCGSMFGLRQTRHRHFECVNWVPEYKRLYCDHTKHKGNQHCIVGGFTGSIHDAAISMNCYPGRLRSEIKEGIPPDYTHFVFSTFLTSVLPINNCSGL